MPNINSTLPDALPSSRRLIRSTITAAVIAGVLLVTVVFPAEYGLDVTGVGRVLGLTEMGEIKATLAQEANAGRVEVPAVSTPAATPPVTVASASPVPASTPADPVIAGRNSHETRLLLRPGEGKEIKLVMSEGSRVQYSWSTDRGVVNYDTHADSVTPKRDYHGYAKGIGVPSDTGELIAAFDGSHGWFWRNRTDQAVTLTLRTEGEYSELKELR